MEDTRTKISDEYLRVRKMESDLDDSDKIYSFEDFVKANDRACLYFLYHKLNDFLEWDK